MKHLCMRSLMKCAEKTPSKALVGSWLLLPQKRQSSTLLRLPRLSRRGKRLSPTGLAQATPSSCHGSSQFMLRQSVLFSLSPPHPQVKHQINPHQATHITFVSGHVATHHPTSLESIPVSTSQGGLDNSFPTDILRQKVISSTVPLSHLANTNHPRENVRRRCHRPNGKHHPQ